MYNSGNINLNFYDVVFFFIIAVVIPMLSFLSHRNVEDIPDIEYNLPPKKHLYYTNGLMLFIGSLIVLTLWNLNDRDFSMLGFRSPVISDSVIIISVIVLSIYLIDAAFGYISFGKSTADEKNELSQVMPSTWSDFRHFIFLAFAAGICEEIMFRAFLINFIVVAFSGSAYASTMAIILPAFVFSLSHLYQGWLSVVKIFAISLLFGILFVASKSLLLVICIHIFVDLVSGFLMVIASR